MREIKDKCTNQGAASDFHFNPADVKGWKYLGVCSQDGLCYSDFNENFYGDAKEITLDQLDDWLGIGPDDVEWKNGDECVFDNKANLEFSSFTLEYLHQTAKIHYRFKNSFGSDMLLIEFDYGHCCAVIEKCVSKPETTQQKAERERIELVRKACPTVHHDYHIMSKSDRSFLEKSGLEWLKAFEKEKLNQQ